MKHQQLFSIFILSLIFSISAFSQSQKISFQGTLKDANGRSVSDGVYSVDFKLYNVESGGTALWVETAMVDVTGGIYSHYLGNVTPLAAGIFDQTLFLGIKVGSFELVPRSELTYAPYTFAASSVTCSGALGDVKYSILNPMQFEAANGACWVPMDGAAMTGSSLASILMRDTLPDMSGLFIRAQEYTEGNDAGRTTLSPIATLQSGEAGPHSHTMEEAGAHTHNHNASGSNKGLAYRNGVETSDGMDNSPGELNLRYVQPLVINSGGAHEHTINDNDGEETRPKNMNFYIYIRIN